jgi:hypothetical protein
MKVQHRHRDRLHCRMSTLRFGWAFHPAACGCDDRLTTEEQPGAALQYALPPQCLGHGLLHDSDHAGARTFRDCWIRVVLMFRWSRLG